MDPLTEPSVSHPQTTPAPMATGTGQVPASGVHLGAHCQQRSGQRAQDSRFGHRRRRPSTGTARCRAHRLLHVRCRRLQAASDRSEAALLGRGCRVAALRMVGVPVRDPLRVKGLLSTPCLRMVEVARLFPLRMAGVFGDWR
jgi:hypothetical protein